MRVNKMKLFTGTMLSLLLCGVAGYAAIAEPMDQQTQGQDRNSIDQREPMGQPTQTQYRNQLEQTQAMRGRITSITGSVATVRMENGERRTIGISRLQNLQLVPGTVVLIQNRGIIEFGRTAAGGNEFGRSMAQAQRMRGTITSITGSVATVEMENGDTQTVGISRVQHSALVPGTEVMIEDGRIVGVGSAMDSTQPNSNLRDNNELGQTNPRSFNQRSTTNETIITPSNQRQQPGMSQPDHNSVNDMQEQPSSQY